MADRPNKTTSRCRHSLGILVVVMALGMLQTNVLRGADELASHDQLTPLAVQTVARPRPVAGSDGKTHLVYELLLRNVTRAPVRITTFVVTDVATDRALLRLAGNEVKTILSEGGGRGQADELPAGATGTLWMDITVASDASPIRQLMHDLTVEIGEQSVRYRCAPVDVDATPAIRLGSPLAGSGWIAADSCCQNIRHRRAMLCINGSLCLSQRYAVDWERINNDSTIYVGDAKDPASYCCYGQPVYAVADGTIVSAVDRFEDIVPGKLPELASLGDADGNHIVLSLPDGSYALYAHLKPGSLVVKAGDTVTKGQKIAEVGNTSAPHLHFHVMDGPSPLTSSGLPYVLERLDVVGIVPSTEAFDRAEVDGKPVPIDTVNPSGPMTDVMPMDLSVVTLLARGEGAQRPPNVVIIFTDDQGYADLGCFGSTTIRTPHIDRMADEGMRFTSFYAQAVCGPSRAALMTGCYPIRVAEPSNRKNQHTILHTKEITLAEVLEARGYATGCIGKWHIAGSEGDPTKLDRSLMPLGQGFDSFFGTPAYNGFTVHVGDAAFRSVLMRNHEVIVPAVESWDDITQRYTDEAIRFIRANRDQPFFLYLAHTMPHVPLGASEAFRGRSKGGPYGDAIEEIDHSTGRILDTIRDLDLADNTIVVFTSDNGPWIETTRGMTPGGKAFIPRNHSGSADPLRGSKMLTWEGGMRVPCVVWAPGRVPAGQTCDAVAATIDLLPTFAKLAGAALPADLAIDGRDITPLLIAQPGSMSPHDDGGLFYYRFTTLEAVRSGP